MASMLMKMACVVLACMVVFAPHAEALTCGQVVTSVLPCLNYLRSGGKPTPACCNGVKSLNNAARTSADRKVACGCLKNSYSANPGISPANAASLPSMCGVNIPYKISPNTDCSKVN